MVITAVLGQIYSDNPTKHGGGGFENEPGKQCRQSKYQAQINLFVLVVFIRQAGTSVEKMAPYDWAVGNPVGDLLN